MRLFVLRPSAAFLMLPALLSLAEAAEDAHKGGGFPPFDSATFAGQLFWLAILFGLLYWLMSKKALPRIASILEARRETIAAALRSADAAQKSAEAAAMAQEQALAKAKSDAQGIAEMARAKSNGEIEATRKSVEKTLSDKLAAAEASIQASKSAAMGNVEGIASELVGAMVEQLTGKAPNAASIQAAMNAAQGK